MTKKEFELDYQNRKLKVEFSNLTEQANSSCLVSYGETVALVTLVTTDEIKNTDFVPLTVDYEEKYYAAGKIYGSRFVRRESRPTETAILTGRLIDRIIRPLIDQNYRKNIQIVITVLSIDNENDPDFVGLLGASLALALSRVPFKITSGVRLARKDQELIVMPSYEQREECAFDAFFAGTENKINMIELFGKEIQESEVCQVSQTAFEEIKKLINWEKEIISNFEIEKEEVREVQEINPDFSKLVNEFLNQNLEKTLYSTDKGDNWSKDRITRITQELKEYLISNNLEDNLELGLRILDKRIDDLIHFKAIKENKRIDNRELNELRPIETQIDILPRAHGSALFLRGLTHALSVVTLGSPSDYLLVQGMELTSEKRFMHHYNFPPFSTGEIGSFRGPGRREIGHGALAEKALTPFIPDSEEFPYTIRVVTEILSSNGSTSMASVCASSMALMAAGVPLKKHLAGIAMGLMANESGEYKILTDIQGPEDHFGDMDFKVAGTKDGITAIQLDVKIEGLTLEIIKETLDQAKKARIQIIEKMEQTIDKPREKISKYAPIVKMLKISKEKIGEIIGSGGRNIHSIIEKTNTTIDIKEDGTVYITGTDENSVNEALKIIEDNSREITQGEIFEGKISKLYDFGAIVDFANNHQGLLHISEISPTYITNINDVLKIGQILPVKVIEISPEGKIKLSLKETGAKIKVPDNNRKPTSKKFESKRNFNRQK